MNSRTLRVTATLTLLCTAGPMGTCAAADTTAAALATDTPAAKPEGTGTDARTELHRKLAALEWIKGPTSVTVSGNARLTIPEGYVFLDPANTAKLDELEQNLSDGKEVMVGPSDLSWSAYLEFDPGGYVKDDEKIDAPALLKSLKENTAAENEERQKRGWSPLEISGWALPPAYNHDTKRLEWATQIQSQGRHGVNFFPKIRGRRGHTSVVMVASPQELTTAETALDHILDGYAFNSGETYAEWKQGDKVAEYGLAALVLGGAAAIATKKGFWAIMVGFFAAAWKAVAAAAVAAVAWLRGHFKKKA